MAPVVLLVPGCTGLEGGGILELTFGVKFVTFPKGALDVSGTETEGQTLRMEHYFNST